MIRSAALVLASMFLGFGIARATVVGGGSHTTLHQRTHGWMARDADTKHAWLYVSCPIDGNNVLIYDLQKLGIPEIGEISQGLSHPTGMAIDASGTLYVSNYYGGDVTIYAAGSTAPTLTLSEGLAVPNGIALDAAGNVWVDNKGSPPDFVVYPPGQTAPSKTIVDPLIQNPSQLSFDAAGNLYEFDVPGVIEIPVGSQQPVLLNLQGFTNADGSVVVDPTDGDILLAAIHNGKQSVFVYPPGETSPGRIFVTGSFADFLTYGTIRRTQYLFAPDSAGNTLWAFRRDARKPNFSFATCQYPRATAFKPAGIP